MQKSMQPEHRRWNKLDGVFHLKNIIENRKLQNIALERFEVISKERLAEIVRGERMAQTVLARTSSKKNSTFDFWKIQPRERFEPGEKRNTMKLIGFFERMKNHEEATGEKLDLFVLYIPNFTYLAALEVSFQHGYGRYTVAIKPLGNWGTKTDFTHLEASYVYDGSIYRQTNSAEPLRSIKGEEGKPVPYESLDGWIPKCVESLEKDAPVLLGEFKTEHTLLRLVKYSGIEVPVAFDWLVQYKDDFHAKLEQGAE